MARTAVMIAVRWIDEEASEPREDRATISRAESVNDRRSESRRPLEETPGRLRLTRVPRGDLLVGWWPMRCGRRWLRRRLGERFEHGERHGEFERSGAFVESHGKWNRAGLALQRLHQSLGRPRRGWRHRSLLRVCSGPGSSAG